MKIVKFSTNLQGLKRNYWRRNLKGFFCLEDGTELTDAQVRRIVEYGIKKGYRTERDIPESEIIQLLRKPNRIKDGGVQLELF